LQSRAWQNADGTARVLGHTDDMLKVSGQRLSPVGERA
jgi:acyl-coenzyme A synthetase/AMP-(fatty) acid ligase